MKKILILSFLAVSIINLYSQNKIVYISPLPGSKYINPQNNIIIGFEKPIALDKAELINSIIINGTESGRLAGKIILAENNKKIIY